MNSFTAQLCRFAVTAATVLGSAVLITGTAHATTPDLVSDDHFRATGVRVFDFNSVGIGCRVFGFCDGVTFAQLNSNATTRAQSENKGEPVIADCTVNDLVRVRLIARNASDTVLSGWASARGVDITGPIRPC